MSKKYAQDMFYPKNPNKLIGKQSIMYRSSWELSVMHFFDTHPSIIQWASESISIRYVNPFKPNSPTFYIPDFLVLYQDKFGNHNKELIEVKPRREAIAKFAITAKDKMALQVNTMKWAAAQAFCKKTGLKFVVLTEEQIYAGIK